LATPPDNGLESADALSQAETMIEIAQGHDFLDKNFAP